MGAQRIMDLARGDTAAIEDIAFFCSLVVDLVEGKSERRMLLLLLNEGESENEE